MIERDAFEFVEHKLLRIHRARTVVGVKGDGVNRGVMRVIRHVARHRGKLAARCVDRAALVTVDHPTVKDFDTGFRAVVFGSSLGISRMLAVFNALGGILNIAVHERDSKRSCKVVIPRPRRAVMQRDFLRPGAESQPRGIGLAIRIIGLIDGVCPRPGSALEVAAGDERGALGIGAVVLIRVGRRLRRGINTAGDGSDLRVRLIVNGMVAGSSAVSVDLKAFAELADRRELAGRSITVQNAVAVSIDIDIFNRADLGAGKGRVGVYSSTLCSAGIWAGRRGVGSGRRASVKARAVIIDRAAILRACGNSGQRSRTAVDRGDDTGVGDNGGSCDKGVAFADQIDRGRIIIVRNDIGFSCAAVISGAGTSGICGNVEDLLQVAGVLTLLAVHVGESVSLRG